MAEVKNNNNNNLFQIIIIGGGISGLAAGDALVKKGITNFKILEARDKIGGRVEAYEMGEYTVYF